VTSRTNQSLSITVCFAAGENINLYKKTRKNPGQQMAQFKLKPPGGEPENVMREGKKTFNFQVCKDK
jgi:hypothetical protein